jgi:hypothetical protein
MVVFHVSTFILHLHTAGGFLWTTKPQQMLSAAATFLNLAHLFDAVHADISALVGNQAAGCGTKNAGGLILFQNHLVIIQVDLQFVPLRNIQCAPQFNGKNNPA